MKIKVNIKSASKTRGIEPQIYEINDNIKTTKNLIENLVDIEIDKYKNNEKKKNSQQDISNMLEVGKISFGFKYRESFNSEHGINNKNIDTDEAKAIALEAFTDGLYVMFIGKTKIDVLEEQIDIKENDEVTLVRLTMLAGRYF